MAFLVGTDEAGYGPNLGPLTICGTMWKTRASEKACLYKQLRKSVSNVPADGKLQIADSKAVHKTKSIANLEKNVLAVLRAIHGKTPNTWAELLEMLNIEPSRIKDVCSPKGDPRLKVLSKTDEIDRLAEKFRCDCEKNNVELCKIDAVAVLPSRFNQLVDQLGNKAEVLSSETLAIVKRLCESTSEDIVVCCDKHGGRSKYAGMINQYLTNQFVRVDRESRQLSRYHWREHDRNIDMSFQAKGEFFLPTALSSMIAKYVREVSMQFLNEFWQEKKPGIAPTKGYPVDAKRFKAEIADVQRELGIADSQIWRQR